MEISIINQRAGIENLYVKLNEAFSNNSFTKFYALVAYLSWDGIGLIHEAMEKFYDKGNQISMIVGVANNSSERDVLRYLKQRLPKANIYVFNSASPSYEFHPKLYYFENKKNSLLFIGSNNFTGGGLYSNSECSVKIKFAHNMDRGLYSSVMKVWTTYFDPKTPFSKSNLRKVDNKLLSIYNKNISNNVQKSNLKLRKALASIFPSIIIPKQSHSLVRPAKLKNKMVKIDKKDNKNKRYFILEVKKETGADGTQVQIPVEAIKDYFNVSDVGHQTIELKVNNNPIRPAVICHFKNNTHRISFPEISKFHRPLIIKFIRVEKNIYKILFLKSIAYKNSIKHCVNQVRRDAKRWVIY